MNKIENIKQVNALISETYMLAIIAVIVALVLAFFIAKLILFEGGRNDRSYMKRRIWYIIIGLIAPVSFYLYNMFIVMDKIKKAPLQAKFSDANLYSTLIILVAYVVIGIITMMIFRKSKWGSILGKTK
jgi:formate hydrogenlyase subunit 3/multisubunit Na+/H+ antiporter MnhD subunit